MSICPSVTGGIYVMIVFTYRFGLTFPANTDSRRSNVPEDPAQVGTEYNLHMVHIRETC